MTISTANKIPATSTANSAVDSGSAGRSLSANNKWIDQEKNLFAYSVHNDFLSLFVRFTLFGEIKIGRSA